MDLGARRPVSTFSDDGRVAQFLSNVDGVESGDVADEEPTVRIAGCSAATVGPSGSPAGRQLMIISFDAPRQVTLMDANPDKSGALQLPDQKIHSNPSWAGEGTIVAVIGPTEGDTIALIDVSEALLRPKSGRSCGASASRPNVKPLDPIYSTTTRRCIFVGEDAQGTKLYSVQQGKAEPAKPLGPAGYDPRISGLAYSPDGRCRLCSAHGALAGEVTRSRLGAEPLCQGRTRRQPVPRVEGGRQGSTSRASRRPNAVYR